RTVKYRKLAPKSIWGKVGLGRFLRPYQSKGTKNTPKANSRKRRRSPNTVKKNVAISLPVSVVTSRQQSNNDINFDLFDGIENDLAMVKKCENPILVEPASLNKPSGRKRLSP
ncbi:MAG: hypothetical protein GPJ54_17720, partial [Candidatus Heimdallarchaeota archaeon]|nr:hypothetical protein [Candidatus Heimdallarchaeota archaeon]